MGTNRYRIEKDVTGKEGSRDTVADTPGNAASTPRIARANDANWDWDAASLTDNIIFDYSENA